MMLTFRIVPTIVQTFHQKSVRQKILEIMVYTEERVLKSWKYLFCNKIYDGEEMIQFHFGVPHFAINFFL